MAQVTLVPDASVVSKWILDEADSDKARHLRDLFTREELHFVVPTLLYHELGNVLRFNRDVRPAEAEAFLEVLHSYRFEEVGASKELAIRTLREARALDTTFYDTLYYVIAKDRGAVKVTADKKFAARAQARHCLTLDKAFEEFAG